MNWRNKISNLPPFWRKMMYGSIVVGIMLLVFVVLFFIVGLCMFVAQLPIFIQILIGVVILFIVIYIIGSNIDKGIWR